MVLFRQGKKRKVSKSKIVIKQSEEVKQVKRLNAYFQPKLNQFEISQEKQSNTSQGEQISSDKQEEKVSLQRKEKQTQLLTYFKKDKQVPSPQIMQKKKSDQKQKQIIKVDLQPIQQLQEKIPEPKQHQTCLSGIQLQKNLYCIRSLIMKELDENLSDLFQKVVAFTLVAQKVKYQVGESQIPYESLIRITKFIIYKMIIPQPCQNWEFIYSPETSQDFLDDHNIKFIKFWLKTSFHQLKKGKKIKQVKDDFVIEESSEESAAFSSTDITENEQDLLYQLKMDMKTQKWKYFLLRLTGTSGIGKASLIHAIAKENNIEVIETNELTCKKDFESLFQTQKVNITNNIFSSSKSKSKNNGREDLFTINEKQNIKKIILHRSNLPKFFKEILQEQKVPFIWIHDKESDNTKLNALFDLFEPTPHSNQEISILVYLILIINYNFSDCLSSIRKIINQQLSSEILKQIELDGQFFESFNINLEHYADQLQTIIDEKVFQAPLSFIQTVELTFNMQGNLRQIFNWLQLYTQDKNISDVHYRQINEINQKQCKQQVIEKLIYQSNNQGDKVDNRCLVINDMNFDDIRDELKRIEQLQLLDCCKTPYLDKQTQECSDIYSVRGMILRRYLGKTFLKSFHQEDYYTINKILKVIQQQSMNTLRNFHQNHLRTIEPGLEGITRRGSIKLICNQQVLLLKRYQGLQTLLTSREDYELFKYFGRLDTLISIRGQPRQSQKRLVQNQFD